MSAFTPKADTDQRLTRVSFGPQADSCAAQMVDQTQQCKTAKRATSQIEVGRYSFLWFLGYIPPAIFRKRRFSIYLRAFNRYAWVLKTDLAGFFGGDETICKGFSSRASLPLRSVPGLHSPPTCL
jgi:hypothetical protein